MKKIMILMVMVSVFGSLTVFAGPGPIIINAVQDSKAVGTVYYASEFAIQDPKAVGVVFGLSFDGRKGSAVQDSKAVGPSNFSAFQDPKAVSKESTSDDARVLDLNQGF